eukprot:6639403-Heterocapsa_arctica.AAC.1
MTVIKKPAARSGRSGRYPKGKPRLGQWPSGLYPKGKPRVGQRRAAETAMQAKEAARMAEEDAQG